jgi:3-methyl-2-oxobutanoate hydroxymethyltransferase
MRVTITEIKEMKQRKEKIPMLTAYDYVMAKIVDEAGVPLILVGDSLGMVILGYESTIPVTMEEMIHHTKAVVRGAKKALIIGDMPFMTYHISVADALHNAAMFIQDGGAQAVKLEGGEARGKEAEEAKKLLNDARVLEEAGAFAVVLECTPAPLSKLITQKLTIPTIGIGAGPDCDGQVQVISDMLGLYTDFVPRHAKQYARLSGEIKTAVSSYISEVKSLSFPTMEHSYIMDESLIKQLEAES